MDPSTSQLVSPALSKQDLEDTHSLLEALYGFGKRPEDDKKLAKLLRHTEHRVSRSSHDKGKGKGRETVTDDEGKEDGAEDEAFAITSWKMQDYAYKRDPCPYPTRARGLFTAGRERIVARAYDKFFNVDEVSWTKWDKLPDLTAPPYYLTLKSNGCLILIAALSPTELLVTSKHAIGHAKEEGAVSHAEMGERWLDRGLKKAGKTREELAERLWRENWTCVAELCDDSFEEHILPYSAETSGLHLHGLVYNHPTLLTLPPPDVTAVAHEYGFIETAYTVLQSVAEIRAFVRSVVDNGGVWGGVPVEGFVVRAGLMPGSLAAQPQPNDLDEDNWEDKRRTFMWKIKFDHPYLMWREWRETTKRILTEKKKAGDDVAKRGREIKARQQDRSRAKDPDTDADLSEAFKRAGVSTAAEHSSRSNGKGSLKATIDEREEGDEETTALPDTATALPSAVRADKIRNPETRLYAIWVEQHMRVHPEAFAEYQDNRGIIAVREAFLKWRSETDEGRAMEEEILGDKNKKGRKVNGAGAAGVNGEKEEKDSRRFDKTLIVPVAVPGCGKTLLGVALTHLFGFAHTQSDDVTEKKAAKHFEAKVAKLLESNDVVFADKNNHLKQHREAMADIAAKSKSSVRLLAIVWPLNTHPHNEIHRICSDRIVARGENHQSLRPVETGEHEAILLRFFGQADPFDMALHAGSDARFDELLELDIAWGFRRSLEAVVEELLRLGDVKGVDKRPTDQQLDEAVLAAQGYKPSVYKEMKLDGLDGASKGGKSKGPRYYGIAVEVDLPSLLRKYFATDKQLKKEHAFFDTLLEKDRVEKKPHVTLIHESELKLKEDGSNTDSEVAFCTSLWDKCKLAASKWGTEAVEVTLTLGPLLVWDGRAMSIQVSKVEYGGSSIDPKDMPSDERKDSYHITVGTLSQEIRPIEGRWLLEAAMKGEKVSKGGKEMAVMDIETVEVRGRIRGLF